MSGWTIERDCDMVATLKLQPFEKSGDVRWVLLQSDEHVDNAHSDLGTIREHMRLAQERGAPILKFGDSVCAMQGKWDKRADPMQLREELRGGNYLDLLTNYVSGVYQPYARSIAAIGYGNHETSILKYHQTDLLERIVDRLRAAGSPVVKLGYTGFIRLAAQLGSTRRQFLIHFHHGYGGGGEVTRGMIDNSRTRSMYLADVYYSGNIHRRNADENLLSVVNSSGKFERRQQWFLRGSCYKHEDGPGGYHTEKGRAARPLGGWFLKITAGRTKTDVKFELKPEIP